MRANKFLWNQPGGVGAIYRKIFFKGILGNEGTGIRKPLPTSISVHRSEISACKSGSLSLSFKPQKSKTRRLPLVKQRANIYLREVVKTILHARDSLLGEGMGGGVREETIGL